MATRLPYLAADLIDMLDEAYPPRCIAPGQTVESAHRYAGARSLIDSLRAMQARGEVDPTKKILE